MLLIIDFSASRQSFKRKNRDASKMQDAIFNKCVVMREFLEQKKKKKKRLIENKKELINSTCLDLGLKYKGSYLHRSPWPLRANI